MNVQLTFEEIELLHKILEAYIGDLRVEIHHTDTSTYKDELHHEEATLAALQHKLQMVENYQPQ